MWKCCVGCVIYAAVPLQLWKSGSEIAGTRGRYMARPFKFAVTTDNFRTGSTFQFNKKASARLQQR
jgi:hypothetical protein